jgi:hypothetical protein
LDPRIQDAASKDFRGKSVFDCDWGATSCWIQQTAFWDIEPVNQERPFLALLGRKPEGSNPHLKHF